MNKPTLIAAAIAIPLLGYILIFSFLAHDSRTNDTNEPEVVTSDQLPPSADPLALVPEGYRRLDDNTIVIDVAVLPGTLSALWVAFGTQADALDSTSPRMTNELGMGVAGEYGLYSVIVSPLDLQPGVSYFYRVVGETTDGDVLTSGLNRFTAGK